MMVLGGRSTILLVLIVKTVAASTTTMTVVVPSSSSDGTSTTTNVSTTTQFTTSTSSTTTGSTTRSSSSSSTATSTNSSHNETIVHVLIGFIVVLAIVFLLLVVPPIYRWIVRQIPISQKRIDGRYETIESWLITKRVRIHDTCCQAIREKWSSSNCYDHHPPNSNSSNKNKRVVITGQGQPEQDSHDDNSHNNEIYCTVIKTCNSYDTAETESPDRDDDDDEFDDKHHTMETGGITGNKRGQDCLGYEIEEENILECPICMEPFQPHDIVSWSPAHYRTLLAAASAATTSNSTVPMEEINNDGSNLNMNVAASTATTCTHTYHHACIKEWLLRHRECVLCRATFLPIDNVPVSSSKSWKMVSNMMLLGGMNHHARHSSNNPIHNPGLQQQPTTFQVCLDSMIAQSACTYFCLRDGLVVLDIPSSSSILIPGGSTKRQLYRLHGDTRNVFEPQFVQLEPREQITLPVTSNTTNNAATTTSITTRSVSTGMTSNTNNTVTKSTSKKEMNLIRRLTSNSVKRKELQCTRAVVHTGGRSNHWWGNWGRGRRCHRGNENTNSHNNDISESQQQPTEQDNSIYNNYSRNSGRTATRMMVTNEQHQQSSSSSNSRSSNGWPYYHSHDIPTTTGSGISSRNSNDRINYNNNNHDTETILINTISDEATVQKTSAVVVSMISTMGDNNEEENKDVIEVIDHKAKAS